VRPEQLQARGGQVRCGRCMHAFDGFQGLAVEGPGALPEPASVQRAAAGHTDLRSSVPQAANVGRAFDSSGIDNGAMTAPPVRQQRATIAACFLLALLLFGQVLYLFRGELAARSSLMKTALTGACRIAGCAVSLPQRPDLVKIEASDVNMIDTRRPAFIQLTATLRNYADYDVAYPALDLVLTNATEHALARRIFLPEEYLDGTRDPLAGMPPRGEITVALDLDTGNLNPAGFRVDLLPAR